MPNFNVEYTCNIRNWGSVSLSADNADQAEDIAYREIKDLYDDVSDIEITGVREELDGDN